VASDRIRPLTIDFPFARAGSALEIDFGIQTPHQFWGVRWHRFRRPFRTVSSSPLTEKLTRTIVGFSRRSGEFDLLAFLGFQRKRINVEAKPALRLQNTGRRTCAPKFGGIGVPARSDVLTPRMRTNEIFDLSALIFSPPRLMRSFLRPLDMCSLGGAGVPRLPEAIRSHQA